MTNFLEIAGRKIGEEYAPLVVAEIGINHEGSLETAIKIAQAAIDAVGTAWLRDALMNQPTLEEFL